MSGPAIRGRKSGYTCRGVSRPLGKIPRRTTVPPIFPTNSPPDAFAMHQSLWCPPGDSGFTFPYAHQSRPHPAVHDRPPSYRNEMETTCAYDCNRTDSVFGPGDMPCNRPKLKGGIELPNGTQACCAHRPAVASIGRARSPTDVPWRFFALLNAARREVGEGSRSGPPEFVQKCGRG